MSALLRAVDTAAIAPLRPVGSARARAGPIRLDPGALPNDELLALVLSGAGASAAARTILDEVGIAGLAEPSASDLGPLGRTRTLRLLAAVELGRRVASAWPPAGWRIRSPADLAERLLPAMGHLEREELRSVLLNTKNVVTGMVTVYAGNLAGSSVRIGEVFRDAVRRQAASMVVVHNHPSGDPSPSAEDLRITRELAEAGRLLDIDLLDHLVIGHGRWVSLRALGAL
ncbi:MAG: DNA repair protein RadC [Chloroflexota bacterium]